MNVIIQAILVFAKLYGYGLCQFLIGMQSNSNVSKMYKMQSYIWCVTKVWPVGHMLASNFVKVNILTCLYLLYLVTQSGALKT